MANKECWLGKYLRKKNRAKTPEKFNRFARLYWRYHFQVYAKHICLWDYDQW